jgi:hypothetical protein
VRAVAAGRRRRRVSRRAVGDVGVMDESRVAARSSISGSWRGGGLLASWPEANAGEDGASGCARGRGSHGHARHARVGR